MRIEGVDHEVLIATDVERDSMQWECYLADGTDRRCSWRWFGWMAARSGLSFSMRLICP